MDATPTAIRLVLEVSPEAGPVAGRLHLEDRLVRAFSGYLELMSLLEEIRRTQRPQDSRGDLRVSTPTSKPKD